MKGGSDRLRLFSERNAQGAQTSVYNVKTKKWIENIDDGKEKAAAYAAAHLQRVANLELPRLEWKASRAA